MMGFLETYVEKKSECKMLLGTNPCTRMEEELSSRSQSTLPTQWKVGHSGTVIAYSELSCIGPKPQGFKKTFLLG